MGKCRIALRYVGNKTLPHVACAHVHSPEPQNPGGLAVHCVPIAIGQQGTSPYTNRGVVKWALDRSIGLAIEVGGSHFDLAMGPLLSKP